MMAKANRRRCGNCSKDVKNYFPCKTCGLLICGRCIIHDNCPDCYYNIGKEVRYFEESYKENVSEGRIFSPFI